MVHKIGVICRAQNLLFCSYIWSVLVVLLSGQVYRKLNAMVVTTW